ncbi:MAG: hypothetical protein CMF29_00975 [Kiritimatiellaceae bacterium]|nr:hypothetical protein [Kiritimatiellaceae bacterium]|tara:strand:+ start:36 stop:443 length:408 start_codon:yes stop_codon:yes gene_type:complete
MADAVATQTIQDGAKTAIFRFTNVSDGTGETTVAKIDVSALSSDPMTGAACTGCTIQKIYYSTIGMGVKIFFDASSNVLAWQLNADWADTLDFTDFTGIPNNAGSGKTGDVLFTTVDHSSGDVYNIVMQVSKSYG